METGDVVLSLFFLTKVIAPFVGDIQLCVQMHLKRIITDPEKGTDDRHSKPKIQKCTTDDDKHTGVQEENEIDRREKKKKHTTKENEVENKRRKEEALKEQRRRQEQEKEEERLKQEEKRKKKLENVQKFRNEVEKCKELGYLNPNSKPRGIPNLGNTCYLNSLLQVLSWTPLLGQQLAKQLWKSVEKIEEIDIDNVSADNVPTRLFKLLWTVHKQSGNTMTLRDELPGNILQEARKLNDQFMGYRQQDSFEMYNTLIGGVEDEARLVPFPFQHEDNNEMTDTDILMRKSDVSRLIGGTFVTVWYYESCEHVELTFQRFTSVSVPVPKTRTDLPKSKPVNCSKRKRKDGEQTVKTVTENSENRCVPMDEDVQCSKRGPCGNNIDEEGRGQDKPHDNPSAVDRNLNENGTTMTTKPKKKRKKRNKGNNKKRKTDNNKGEDTNDTEVKASSERHNDKAQSETDDMTQPTEPRNTTDEGSLPYRQDGQAASVTGETKEDKVQPTDTRSTTKEASLSGEPSLTGETQEGIGQSEETRSHSNADSFPKEPSETGETQEDRAHPADTKNTTKEVSLPKEPSETGETHEDKTHPADTRNTTKEVSLPKEPSETGETHEDKTHPADTRNTTKEVSLPKEPSETGETQEDKAHHADTRSTTNEDSLSTEPSETGKTQEDMIQPADTRNTTNEDSLPMQLSETGETQEDKAHPADTGNTTNEDSLPTEPSERGVTQQEDKAHPADTRNTRNEDSFPKEPSETGETQEDKAHPADTRNTTNNYSFPKEPSETGETHEDKAHPADTRKTTNDDSFPKEPSETGETQEDKTHPADTRNTTKEVSLPKEPSETDETPEDKAHPADTRNTTNEDSLPTEPSGTGKTQEDKAHPADTRNITKEVSLPKEPSETGETQEDKAHPADTRNTMNEDSLPTEPSETGKTQEDMVHPADTRNTTNEDSLSEEYNGKAEKCETQEDPAIHLAETEKPTGDNTLSHGNNDKAPSKKGIIPQEPVQHTDSRRTTNGDSLPEEPSKTSVIHQEPVQHAESKRTTSGDSFPEGPSETDVIHQDPVQHAETMQEECPAQLTETENLTEEYALSEKQNGNVSSEQSENTALYGHTGHRDSWTVTPINKNVANIANPEELPAIFSNKVSTESDKSKHATWSEATKNDIFTDHGNKNESMNVDSEAITESVLIEQEIARNYESDQDTSMDDDTRVNVTIKVKPDNTGVDLKPGTTAFTVNIDQMTYIANGNYSPIQADSATKTDVVVHPIKSRRYEDSVSMTPNYDSNTQRNQLPPEYEHLPPNTGTTWTENGQRLVDAHNENYAECNVDFAGDKSANVESDCSEYRTAENGNSNESSEDEQQPIVTILPHQPLESMRENPTDLERGLHELTEEEIWDESMIGCRICSSSNSHGKQTHKKLLIIGLPPIFVVHINKIEKDGYGGLQKINKTVTYPKYLNVAPFCSSALQKTEVGMSTTRTWFRLYGVVSHGGSIHGGHYTAYVRASPQNASSLYNNFLKTEWTDPERVEADIKSFWQDTSHSRNMSPTGAPKDTVPERWYHISDSMVWDSDEHSATNDGNAYILMYERCC